MFILDDRLQQDTVLLGDFSLCRLLLMNDAQYPWLILVPRRAGISEVFQLDMADRALLWEETTRVAQVLKAIFAADKINIGALGNMVSQLHIHVIARHRGDAAWPGAVWGKHPAQPYSAGQIAEIRGKLKPALLPESNLRAGEE